MAINIQLNNDYRITSDSQQYILQKSSITKEGTTRWRSVKFSGSLAGIAIMWKDLELLECDAESFNQILQKQEELNKTITSLVQR